MRWLIYLGIFCVLALLGLGAYHQWHSQPKVADVVNLEDDDPDLNSTDEPTRKTAEARKKYAFQNLEARIPKGKGYPPGKSYSKVAAERWSNFGKEIEEAHARRSTILKALHEKTKKFFVNSPGFGPGRNFKLSDEDVLLFDNWSITEDAPQPGPAADFPLSAGETLTEVSPVGKLYRQLHIFNLRLFLNPWGLGYVQDHQHVAGFKSHGFRSELPNWSQFFDVNWRVDNILLVGILMHEQPVVYLSEKLPSMEQARTGKTRSLDLFESAGLEVLKGGEDLYIVQKDDTLRMLGAIRAMKQCLLCHDAQLGDMLGAFSYTLRPAPAPKTPKKD